MGEDGELKGRRVFIVEDDAMLTMMTRDLLEEAGCEIADSAARLDEALRKSSTVEFDVALLDVNLHGEHAFAVVEAMRERGRPFVIVTGYADTAMPDSLDGAPLLQKPYRRRDLEAALRDALRGG